MGPTLHGRLVLPYTTGTTDPVYKLISANIIIPATNPPHWKGKKIIASYQTLPFKTGFLSRTYEIQL